MPEEMTFRLMDLRLGNAITGGAALRLGVPVIATPFHIGIPLGIARRALDEITGQAVEKERGFPTSPLATHPHFQFALGKASWNSLPLARSRYKSFPTSGIKHERVEPHRRSSKPKHMLVETRFLANAKEY